MIIKLHLERAFSRVAGYSIKTPLISNEFLDDFFEAQILLKCEQFQSIGAFKIRGAANFALQLTEKERSNGLVTHSSGNHAQAVAYMAYKLGIKAFVVMPKNSNKRKIANAKKWGAEIYLCEPTIESRTETAETISTKTGARIIPPFDHDWIIEGQATCAMEMMAVCNDLDMIVAPLGGGGLLAGTALASQFFSNGIKVIGAEPEQAADGFLGLKSGTRKTDFPVNTVADGLRTPVGEVPFAILKATKPEVWLAPEKEIMPWMFRLWEETKTIIEPSSAVPFAAMEQMKDQLKGKKTGVIITGGNVDFSAWN